MSLRDELATQFQVVEDLAVEHQREPAISVVHGLLAAFRIDDRQARVGEGDAFADMRARSIRAAVGQGGDHPCDLLPRRVRVGNGARETCNPAHAPDPLHFPI